MDEILRPGEMRPASSASSYETPFDVIELPSLGKLYPEGSTMFGKNSLEVQYLTAAQEDILTSPNLLQSGKLLEILIKSVLRDKKVDPNDMLLGDRNTIIVWLRSTGYGEDYPVQMTCKECNATYVYEFDLSTLDIRKLEVDDVQDGLFSYTLPHSKKEVRFNLLTAGDEYTISKTSSSKKLKLGSSIDNSLSMKMTMMIKEIDGNSDRDFIRNFISTMRVKDTHAFRAYVASIEPGVVMEQECQCPTCGYQSQEVVPIRANFFWPDAGV